MISQLATRRVSITIAHALMIAVIAGAAFAAGLLLRPWDSSAAPGGMLEACINRYTGAVRMSPAGTINCSPAESKVVWPASQASTHYELRGHVFNVAAGERLAHTFYCEPGEILTGGGTTVSSGLQIFASSAVNDNHVVEGTPTGWIAGAYNPDTTDFGAVFVSMICASTSP